MNKTFKLFLVSIWLMSSTVMYGLITPRFSGGTGTEADPYKIATLDDLEFLSENSTYWAAGTYFIQTADIDASATSTWNDNGAGGYYGFSPIGTATASFNGSYDGQGHTISGLYINRSTGDIFGFFTITDVSSTIQNLGLIGVNITSTGITGSLVGANKGTITNCYSTGTVVSNGNIEAGKAGGLIGWNYVPGVVTNCYSACSVSGSTAGGLVGELLYGATIQSSYSTGSVTGSNCTGGLVGFIQGSSPQSIITNCYSTASVNGSGSDAGGLIGRQVGYSKTENCYSTGSVTGTATYKGGFVGFIGSTSPTSIAYINASYWDSETSDLSAGFGGKSFRYTVITLTGNTTANMQLQGSYSGWDFTGETTNGTNDYWSIDATKNDGYPYLAWQTFAPPAQPMQLVFTTTAASQSIELPLYGTVNCTVDWGDGSATEDFTTTGDKPHTFSTAGTYTVEISGSLTQFGQDWNAWTGVGYLTEVVSFGDIGLTSLYGAFVDADNLTSVPASLPAEITNLVDVFRSVDKTSITNLDLWDLSHVTNMSRMFFSASNFNQDISGWDVSSATNMNNMFRMASNFNQDISSWNVANVTDMGYMFGSASNFDQNLGDWQIGLVSTMVNMFYGVTLSTVNYDALLIGWAAQTVKPNVNFHGGNSKYSAGAAATARGTLTGGTNLWTITDGGINDLGTGVENTNNMISLQVSPNPVMNQFRIKGLAGKAEITITDMTGKVCQKTQVSAASVVSVENLAKGMYVVNIKIADKSTQLKLVKK